MVDDGGRSNSKFQIPNSEIRNPKSEIRSERAPIHFRFWIYECLEVRELHGGRLLCTIFVRAESPQYYSLG